ISMRKITISILMIFAFVQISLSQVKWTADPMHSNVHFSINHLGISFVDGDFTKFEGTVETKDESDFNQSKFNFTVDVNSINTRVKQRDDHLRSDDFFDVEKYPNITLKNAKLSKNKEGNYVLKGDLTIKDVTKPVTFDVVFHGVITDPWGKTRAGLTATIEVNRMDFNIKYDKKLPSGVDEVAKKVKITVNTELVKD